MWGKRFRVWKTWQQRILKSQLSALHFNRNGKWKSRMWQIILMHQLPIKQTLLTDAVMASLSANEGYHFFRDPALTWWNGWGLIYGQSIRVTASSWSKNYQSAELPSMLHLSFLHGDEDWRERQKSVLLPEPLTGQPSGRLHQLSYTSVCGTSGPQPLDEAVNPEKTVLVEGLPFKYIFWHGLMQAWKHQSCIKSLLRFHHHVFLLVNMWPDSYDLYVLCYNHHHARLLVNRPLF